MRKLITALLTVVLFIWSCEPNENVPQTVEFNPTLKDKLTRVDPSSVENRNGRTAGIEQWIASVNETIASQGLAIQKMEFLGAEQAGNTVFFANNGNKQLSSDFVPNDPRNGTGIDVPYVIDGTELGTSSGMSEFETYSATVAAMETWGNVTCSSGLEIPNLGVAPFDIGYVQYLLGFGGIAGYFPGTVVHGGILPGAFFDAVSPGGASSILGVTFTFVWLDDLDADGKSDVAIKEIYINDVFNWQDAPDDVLGNGIYDLETVILHEAGHALSQAHFGKAFASGNGKLHFAPAALMNAGYSVARRNISGTDNAGHCSNWSNWPNN
ncbi:hypothetical protein [uncultured Imperialibacter sp.]|uniref:hypothetical protein n=1 Tax=uncultured Imperialibacter sp. TaxID=1672639 RepID=UPI0030D84478|tara:strand:- start:3038 stop:4012 length:975 start_codon:yes stop_codon:yes gene_type:complete